VVVTGGPSQAGPCNAGIQVAKLHSSSDYQYVVKVHTPAGDNQSNPAGVHTTNISGNAVCFNDTGSDDPAHHHWCDDADNGRQVRTATSEGAGLIGRADQGESLAALCKTNGALMKAYAYNKGKSDTSVWILVNFRGRQGYLSFAWYNLPGQNINSTGAIPDC
jgi:hypothetical protein